ncbi:MAG: hypothetical protein O7D30_01235, partial [Rickettsia endosymbiont of Ixodes persulcatus]|nr:hypothetical protein [Rickettsia endosymbiont of Ixodes persulcatus]
MKYDIITRNVFKSCHKKEIKERTLRPNRKYSVPLISTKYGEATRMYYVPKIFNELPNLAVQFYSFPSVHIYKKKKKKTNTT